MLLDRSCLGLGQLAGSVVSQIGTPRSARIPRPSWPRASQHAVAQAWHRSMPDRADRARRDTEILRDSRRFTVRVEREHHDEPIPLGERAQARCHARRVECGHGRRRGLHGCVHQSRG